MMDANSIAKLLEVVPECLRERPHWVCWRYIQRDKKATKCPYHPRTGQKADTTNPESWSTFDQVVAACQNGDRYAGIGFVFATDDPYCGIDLDHCIEPSTKELKAWAQEFLRLLNSYSEISPSGLGVKIFVAAHKIGERCKTTYQDGAFEIYDHDRFFTVTGQHLAGTPLGVMERQEQTAQVYQQVFQPKQPSRKHAPAQPTSPTGGPQLSDEFIVEKASGNRRNGSKFTSLWSGAWVDWFGSQSEGDSSLIFLLAFYTKDAVQLDRLFRRSGLFRSKWDELHGVKTYGQLTIDRALATVTGQYRSRSSRVPWLRADQPNQPDPQPGQQPRDKDPDFATESSNEVIPLGQRDPKTGRLVLSSRRTLPTAEAYIGDFHMHPEGRTLHSYAGTWLVWRGNRFREIEEESLRQNTLPWLHDALRYYLNPKTHELELIDFESNPSSVKSAVESLRAYAHVPNTRTPPCWLDQREHAPDPRYLLPFPTGTLDVTTNLVIPPTPALFNTNAIDFDYDPQADPPEQWFQFLDQLWGDDAESVMMLQEWMGYCLVADTTQQKMLLMVGPKRSGKGTIGRVLTRLVGSENVVGPTTSSLAGTFGLQPLIGKALAIVSDARFSGENIGVVVERLLCISGEDTLTVDRKFLGGLTMKLPTRLMFLTNELPRMHDSSGALAGRFVILRLTRSFYGHENVRLTQDLMEELPGILLWAIAGLKRLLARGHFVQPSAVGEMVQEMENLASPVLAFVRDCCEVGNGYRAWIDDLYKAWRRWCEDEGRNLITSKQIFGRDLTTAIPGISCRRNHESGRFYEGIALRPGLFN